MPIEVFIAIILRVQRTEDVLARFIGIIYRTLCNSNLAAENLRSLADEGFNLVRWATNSEVKDAKDGSQPDCAIFIDDIKDFDFNN